MKNEERGDFRKKILMKIEDKNQKIQIKLIN